ncbi:MAG: DMT family transporter [Bacillota bacterium]|nr:DMT family transporter [Bacillota bacterium]
MGKLYSALIVLSLIWGTSFLFMKILVASMSPLTVVFGRCLFGAVLLLIIALSSKKKIHFKNLPWGKLVLVALTNNVLPWLLICSSETKISSGLASIVNATTPIWTLLIGFFFFSSKLKKNQWVGIFIGFLGIFILSEIRPGDVFSGNMFGILLMALATFSYGLGAHMTKKYLSSLTILETSVFTLIISATISFILMMGFSPPSHLNVIFTAENLFAFTGLGTLGSGVAYLLYYYLVKKGSPEFASLVTYLVPVSAVIWGASLLKESIHLSMLLGLLVIFTGVYVSSLKYKKQMNEENAA